MAEVTTPQPTTEDFSEYELAADRILEDMRQLETLMQSDRVEIERLKAETHLLPGGVSKTWKGNASRIIPVKGGAGLMWQKLIDFGKQLFALMQKQKKQEEDIKEIRQDMKAMQQDFNHLRQEMNELTRVVERLAYEFQRDRENAERDREIQRLRLENVLLRFERGLPPGNKPKDEN